MFDATSSLGDAQRLGGEERDAQRLGGEEGRTSPAAERSLARMSGSDTSGVCSALAT
jgi:hypothetical protein